MTDLATEELGMFFDYIWKDDPTGFVYVALEKDGDWKKMMFEWPKQRTAIVRQVLKHSALGANVYYSPALYRVARPIKENVKGSWFLWVDFDGNAPVTWDKLDVGVSIPEPSLILVSSLPGHEHCYWELDTFLEDIELLEDRNRSLAYTLKADTSGWDADQVLRPVHTHNYKRDRPVVVKL